MIEVIFWTGAGSMSIGYYRHYYCFYPTYGGVINDTTATSTYFEALMAVVSHNLFRSLSYPVAGLCAEGAVYSQGEGLGFAWVYFLSVWMKSFSYEDEARRFVSRAAQCICVF